MFVKIQYQCHNSDKSKSITGDELTKFIKKKDGMFATLLKEQGYALEMADYDFKTGVRELFFIRVVSA